VHNKVRPTVVLLTFLLAIPAGGQSTSPANGQDVERSVDRLIESADAARDQNRYDEEEAILVEAFRSYPQNVYILWRLTRSSVEAGELSDQRDEKRRRFFEAMQYGKQAIRADSTHHLGFIWLAVAEAAVASVEGVRTKVRLSWDIRRHAEKAIELSPEFDSGYHILGRWHHEVAGIGGVKRALAKVFVGELPEASYDEAIRLYRKAIEINDLIHHRIALVKSLIASGREAEARRELELILNRPGEKRLDEKHKAEARRMLEELQ
jgi:tetratricopeptide (TPR) repeat protein